MDHSIRAEVWEFLLGCYELGTTLAYRERVRQARRFMILNLLIYFLEFQMFLFLKEQADKVVHLVIVHVDEYGYECR